VDLLTRAAKVVMVVTKGRLVAMELKMGAKVPDNTDGEGNDNGEGIGKVTGG